MLEKMEEIRQKYIETQLFEEIAKKVNDQAKVARFAVQRSTALDGFMSTIYKASLVIDTPEGEKTLPLIMKFMRGEESFRESSNSYIQCANEVYAYAEILPAYQQLLDEAGIQDISTNNWVPIAYKAIFGVVEGLSFPEDSIECVLVLEDLKPQKYTLTPNLHLSREELLLMVKPLGQYHALNYALRLIRPEKYRELKNGIKPLYFHRDDPEDLKKNVFRVLHGLGFKRFFDFYDRKLKLEILGTKLDMCLNKLREKYGSEPTRLLEYLRVSIADNPEDDIFSAILHGDFNRNNVLFRYEESNGTKRAVDAKMIDFQELRYGSPALDLSFFMYMNTGPVERETYWLDILKEYHQHMLRTLELVTKAPKEVLANYDFAHFYKHFSKYAFYGVIISIHYLPWLLCSEAERQHLTNCFEKDMHSAEFHKIALEAGGDMANYEILKVVQHACEMGYMDSI